MSTRTGLKFWTTATRTETSVYEAPALTTTTLSTWFQLHFLVLRLVFRYFPQILTPYVSMLCFAKVLFIVEHKKMVVVGIKLFSILDISQKIYFLFFKRLSNNSKSKTSFI